MKVVTFLNAGRWDGDSDLSLERRVKRCEEGVLGGQGQDPLLCHRTLDVVILYDDVFL